MEGRSKVESSPFMRDSRVSYMSLPHEKKGLILEKVKYTIDGSISIIPGSNGGRGYSTFFTLVSFKGYFSLTGFSSSSYLLPTLLGLGFFEAPFYC